MPILILMGEREVHDYNKRSEGVEKNTNFEICHANSC